MGIGHSKKFTSKEIATYYDVSEDHYMYFWDLNQSKALHYGYWNEDTKSFREALSNINSVLANKAQIKEGTNVLDAGCGVGGSSIWLARNLKAQVTGITLSAKQADRANTYVRSNKLEAYARFEVQDYTQTKFDAETFDVVWAIESVCHAASKEAFINEAYRILKPGGRLILADFFILKDVTTIEQKDLDAWAYGWAVPFFEKEDGFASMLTSTGFNTIEMNDSTANIIKSAKRLYYAFFPGWVLSKLYNLFNKNTTEFSKNNVYTAYYQYKTLQKGLWKYVIVSAVK
jgi:tocopherol O-methyltransferase